ncbi:Anaerobic dimethyl sulfoxide reductase chain A, molybdopterin-binding domain [hydrothermal vent metagenome]|uniref:Anaerobic dimethyl sulfoxide reductase chain A, molybdopterin-binding domain n=1 Tax=hydrothermal vent metagenome TaxID=652676 RepID=A0A3B0T8G2_9ZZZZ
MTRADKDPNSAIADEVKKTTCYMCACRCGINVHLTDGKVRYIEGNRDHPVNRGVLCAKGAAGIMHQNSPARLTTPLLRTGPRGRGEFKAIGWDEAMQIAVSWLKPIRQTDPKKLAFFTGRDQSQALTSWWAQSYGTPNYAAHGGFCSVNMAAAGIYTIGGAFWEFGEPDWDRTKMFVLFGVAEDHDSNPIKAGLGKLKARGARVVSVNPVRTGYSAIADDWLAIRPGTDGLLILALVHELLRTRKIDIDYLVRYTNAPWLVRVAPGTGDDGLFVRGDDGEALVFDEGSGGLKSSQERVLRPRLSGEVALPDGGTAMPVFDLMARAYLDPAHAPDAIAERTGLEADRIRALAAELARVAFEEEITVEQPWTDWKGETHDRFIGRPVSMHAMRGISAHSNGFQTCRALHILQILLGSIDCPGGYRYKPPYPKPSYAHPTPAGSLDTLTPNAPLAGPHLGYPHGPEDLLVDEAGNPSRIDKAFSWDAPFSPHGLMHMVIANAHAGDPYKIDTLFLYMANMAWNSSQNTSSVTNMLEAVDPETGEYKIPKIICSDAFASETVAYADLVLPDTTYLERHDCISLLDRPISSAEAVGDAIRHPVVPRTGDVRPFQDVLIDLGARLGLPGFVTESGEAIYSSYADYIVTHERRPGIGPLAGWRGEAGKDAGRGDVNPEQLERYIENGGFWSLPIPAEAQYFKHANQAYQDFAVDMGFFGAPQPVTFQLYLEPLQKLRLAAKGLTRPGPPAHLAEGIALSCAPLPIWYQPFEEAEVGGDEFPFHAITQRPMPMYHSWGSHNAWLRQIIGTNVLFVPETICEDVGLSDGDWVWVVSHHARIKVQVRPMAGVNDRTLWTWNAIGKRAGAWNLAPDAPEATTGFLLNHLIHELRPGPNTPHRRFNSDPITGQAAWFDLRVRLEKVAGDEAAETSPKPPAIKTPPGLPEPPDHVGDLGQKRKRR